MNEGLQLLIPHGWAGARSRVWHAANLPSLSSSHPAMGISALIYTCSDLVFICIMGAAASSLAEALEGLIQYKDNVGTSQDKRHTKGDSNLHLYIPYSLLSCRGKFQSPLLSASPSSRLFSRSRFFHEDALKKSQASIYINRGKV